MIFELNKAYVTDNDVQLICYDKTERNSFLCPFEQIEEDGKKFLRLDVEKTSVFSNEEDSNFPIVTIEVPIIEE